jgi:hypothetical protein
MIKKANGPPDASLPPRRDLLSSGPALHLTHDERLQRIEAMGERISGYIRFMCAAGTLTNASTEVKERAVAAFHERMLVVEKQLARIYEQFRLE